jgi:hypothetical protein
MACSVDCSTAKFNPQIGNSLSRNSALPRPDELMRRLLQAADPGRISITLMLAGLLSGCPSGKPQALMVQLCLQDDQGVSDFLNVMQSVAASENMNFVDVSADTQEKLKTIHAKYAKLATPSSVINVDIESGDRLVVTADNIDLPTYQVSVDFTGNLSPADKQRFVDILIPRLRAQWLVDTVPVGIRPFAMKSCPGQI